MVKLGNITTWVFIICLAIMLPSALWLKPADELASATIFVLGLVDMVAHRSYRRYKWLFMAIVVFSFYALYSVVWVHYNSPAYVLMDFIIELKPFVPVLVLMNLKVDFTPLQRQLTKHVCWVNVVVILACYPMGEAFIERYIGHLAYCGAACFVCAMAYLFVSTDSNGKVDFKTMAVVLLFLVAGLPSGRSKFFAEFVLALFFLLVYRPGMFRHLTFYHVIAVVMVVALVIAVSWNKFSYYFITGNSDTFDPDMIYSFARPVLYYTSWLILVEHFPFGTGLASFASYPSKVSYSGVYYEYAINNVYGLSPHYGAFICDAYFPSLAQFGLVGVVLFIVFWRKAYRLLNALLSLDSRRYRYCYIVGVLLIYFELIECTSGNMFSHHIGLTAMVLMGIIASQLNRESQPARVPQS